jgi:hypothetical protein
MATIFGRAVWISFGLIAGVVPGLAQQRIPVSPDQPAQVYDYIFPVEFEGAKRLSVHGYDNPGLGYSVGYGRGDLTATIYIYDGGQKSIPDNPDDAVVLAELRASLREAMEFSKAKLGVTFSLPDQSKVRRMNCAWLTFSAVSGGTLCVGGANGKFVKFRISAPETKDGVRESVLFMLGWIPTFWPPT